MNTKKNKLVLDLDDELPYEGWAFLHIRTPQPAYAFADGLQRLYGYRFTRIDDLELADAAWPFFIFSDSVLHLKYYLVERPAVALQAPWEAGDKLLFICGDVARREAGRICDDFSSSDPADPLDRLKADHWRLISDYQQRLTMVTMLDFESDMPLSSRAARDRKLMQQYCDKILTIIDLAQLV